MARISTFFLATLYLLLSTTQVMFGDELVANLCSTKRTCGSCIASDPLCNWCKQETFETKRCDLYENLVRKNCSKNNVVSPRSEQKILKDVPLSEAGVKSDVYVQLNPQKISVKLRPHEPVTIPIQFRQAQDYPVDLYYLMDLTNSMRDDKEQLAELGDILADRMSGLTNNFRIGFGSFVDKVVLPYVNTVPRKLKNPCIDGVVCNPPYSFRNHMPLSNNTKQFVQEVKNAFVSANLDDAEGGFDAIMQVLVCKDAINWHDESRKIILFATDSGFHYAGDGKLGGVVLPNDERCHLDSDGYYTMGTVYDYPSISQLNRKVKEEKMSLIFSVTSNQRKSYIKLSNAIEGAHTRVLANDSSNIVRLLVEQYEKISSVVEMTADNVPDNVKLRFESVCPNGKQGKHLCKGLKVGTTVSFNISLELEGCPKAAGKGSRTVTVYPVGLNEVLRIQLDMICECDCEKKAQEVVNSPACSHVGTYECGICSCDDKHYGRKCECDSTDLDEERHLAFCIAENSTDVCSNRGDCICGVCECWPRDNPEEEVTGHQCQCDNFFCDRDEDQQLCGGTRRGTCECGKCKCKKGWKGSVCTCALSNETCIGENGLECSGFGVCECGRCLCSQTAEGRYGGMTCDDCPSCLGKCTEFRTCVECLVWASGEFSHQECEANCSSFTIITVPSLPDDADKSCSFKDDDGCMCEFAYSFSEDNKPIATVVAEKDCIKQANIPFIMLGLVGAIILVGLLVVVVGRLMFYVKDRRAYARFMDDLKATKWGDEQNPIYKAATSTFTNPTYGSKVKD